jgi:hypothetical protein
MRHSSVDRTANRKKWPTVFFAMMIKPASIAYEDSKLN